MTDFHMHVLPGMDDGSGDVETSLGMLGRSVACGVDTVAATPHFYARENSISQFLCRRQAACDELKEAMGGRSDLPRVLLGAEALYFSGMSAVDGLDALCLEGTDLLLLEMPFAPWTDRVLQEVQGIQRDGLRVVAAHIERYLAMQSRKTMEAFFDLGTLIQCNGAFFCARRTARRAVEMLRRGQIQFLGSDAHNLTDRLPDLGQAMACIEKKLGRDALERFAVEGDMLLGGGEGYFDE